jgi:Tfp pilus assembly protein PilE
MMVLIRNGGRGSQAGFGLVETMAGLIVFVILAVVGTKAFKGVVANQKEASQVKALTDAVSMTAEKLSALSVPTLTEAGSKYLQWSEPEVIGNGEYVYRFRTFPNPTIQGAADTAVVGLEVETGNVSNNVFTPSRSFATLIAPHLSSKDKLGQASTAEERDAEASHYASMRQTIEGLKTAAKTDNQKRLNSFNCYDKGQCCGFMKDYFKNPSINPDDGVDQKCLYRCALGGAVPMDEWKSACNADFCAIAPWKTKDQCCAAIATGECKPGSVCAQVCIDCVGEDGSTCGPPVCDGGKWNDFFDCKRGTFCDGTPLPDGNVAGWGNVKALCATNTCASIQSECQARLPSCCRDYWGVLNMGGTPDPNTEICATISRQEECCDMQVEIWDWDQIYCGTGGGTVSAHNKVDGKWYCGFGGEEWDKACAFTKGCSTTFRPSGAPGGTCPSFPGGISTPWKETYPKPKPPVVVTDNGNQTKASDNPPKKTIDISVPPRIPSNRNGGKWGSFGGRE